MKEFIFTYWRELLLVVIAFVELVIFIVRKRPAMNRDDHIKALIAEFAPKFINLAEITFSSGQDKKMFVASEILKKIKHYYVSIDDSYWTSVIMDYIESVLTTPQKKEVH